MRTIKNVILCSYIACAPFLATVEATTTDNNTKNFSWPNGALAAVSLSYDDALNSHLDNAIPALDKYQFKGTFYVVVNSEVIRERLNEWRLIALNGHELGNHTLNHSCSRSKPNRDWVSLDNDLDSISIVQQRRDIVNANTFLKAIDGKDKRTLTLPCFDNIVEQQDFIPFIEELFVGIKTNSRGIPHSMADFNPKRASVIVPHNKTGEQLIAWVKQAKKKGTIVSFTFHGIGGDHLSITNEAHEKLLKYLAENRHEYWVDTYRNISTYLSE